MKKSTKRLFAALLAATSLLALTACGGGKTEAPKTDDSKTEQPASRFVANFIGKANFIDGIFKGRDGEAALVEIGGKTFSIPAPGKMEGVEVGGACCLTVRPESFLLTKDAGALPGTVSRATYYGAKIEYEVMLNEQPIIVEVYNPQLTERFSVGDAVTMSLIEGCVRVLK